MFCVQSFKIQNSNSIHLIEKNIERRKKAPDSKRKTIHLQSKTQS